MPDSNGHRRGISDRQMVLGIIGIVVAAIVIFGGGSYLLARALTVDHSDDTAAERELTELVSSKYADTLQAPGILQAAQSESISPEVDGKIKKVYVEEGDEVVEGDVLFTIKNDTITQDEKSAQTAYKDAQESYGTALGTQKEAKTKLQDAKQQLSDAKKQSKTDEKETDDPDADTDEDTDTDESKSSGSSSKKTSSKKSSKNSKKSGGSTDVASYEASVESAQYAFDIAKAAATTARSTRDDAQATYEAAKEQSDKLTVTATTSGTVTNVQVEKGLNVATVNAQGAAMQIVDLASIVAVLQVPETDIYAVQEDQTVNITSSADASLKVSGTVSAIADAPTDLNTLPASLQDALNASAGQDAATTAEPTAEAPAEEGDADEDEAATTTPTSTFYAVTVSIIFDEDTMKNGMSIEGEIVLEDYGNVFFVPISAVGQNGLGYFYVQVPEEDDTVRDYEVIVIGSTEDEYILRSSTLKTGDQILTTYGS